MMDDDAGAEGKVKALDSWGRAQKSYRQKGWGKNLEKLGRKIGLKMVPRGSLGSPNAPFCMKMLLRIQP